MGVARDRYRMILRREVVVVVDALVCFKSLILNSTADALRSARGRRVTLALLTALRRWREPLEVLKLSMWMLQWVFIVPDRTEWETLSPLFFVLFIF